MSLAKTLVKSNAKKVAIPAVNKDAAKNKISIFKSIVAKSSLIAKTAPFLALLIVYNETNETAILTVLMLPMRIKKE